PAQPTQQVQAGGPLAQCSVTPDTVNPPFAPATWVGSASRDPGGLAIVSYVWRLSSVPPGSAAVMPACARNADCGGFTPDVAGTYVGELTVTNSAGITDACTASLEAVPGQHLWVEMYWTHSGDDI